MTLGQPSPNGVSARRSMAHSPGEEPERRQYRQHEQRHADHERPRRRAPKQRGTRLARRVGGWHPGRRRKHRFGRAKVPGIGLQHAIGIQADVPRIRSKRSSNVDVGGQGFEPLCLQSDEMLPSHPCLTACLFDGLSAKEPSGPECLPDADGRGGGSGRARAACGDSVHGAIVARAPRSMWSFRARQRICRSGVAQV